MSSGKRKHIPLDALLQLRQRLDRLPPKSAERAEQVASFGQLYGVSSTSVYRALKDALKVRPAHRADHGTPRILPKQELERYCELIAAMKLRTTNKKGRHLSTARAIELLEEFGVETPLWIEPDRGAPTLMLFSVVDDRSGVCYQEYRCVSMAKTPNRHCASCSMRWRRSHSCPAFHSRGVPG